MRIAAMFLVAVLIPAASARTERATPAPFTGSWQSCEDYRGSSICAWTTMVQSGARVCGMQQDFATNAWYTHRLVGIAEGNRVRFDRICGDPGSETNTWCAGQVPPGIPPEERVQAGWGRYDLTRSVCNGRLFTARPGQPASCAGLSRTAGTPRVPASRLPLSDDDRAWLTACAAGRE
ncbi:hypothetical protein RCO27_18010 [Sphingosinicella sp. LHD-64]|uniref:hypothetical protein n=1 Tax=Sphingosinicella sp. LHD-64 TaxID=3072139 RepID=UPI00280D9D7C|nr:hypothetical protein [Sphingosinicella sp. LHD-64]MDQ8758125.1 hypothetical protein [Sphingosinicella sp. LHD-64]